MFPHPSAPASSSSSPSLPSSSSSSTTSSSAGITPGNGLQSEVARNTAIRSRTTAISPLRGCMSSPLLQVPMLRGITKGMQETVSVAASAYSSASSFFHNSVYPVFRPYGYADPVLIHGIDELEYKLKQAARERLPSCTARASDILIEGATRDMQKTISVAASAYNSASSFFYNSFFYKEYFCKLAYPLYADFVRFYSNRSHPYYDHDPLERRQADVEYRLKQAAEEGKIEMVLAILRSGELELESCWVIRIFSRAVLHGQIELVRTLWGAFQEENESMLDCIGPPSEKYRKLWADLTIGAAYLFAKVIAQGNLAMAGQLWEWAEPSRKRAMLTFISLRAAWHHPAFIDQLEKWRQEVEILISTGVISSSSRPTLDFYTVPDREPVRGWREVTFSRRTNLERAATGRNYINEKAIGEMAAEIPPAGRLNAAMLKKVSDVANSVASDPANDYAAVLAATRAEAYSIMNATLTLLRAKYTRVLASVLPRPVPDELILPVILTKLIAEYMGGDEVLDNIAMVYAAEAWGEATSNRTAVANTSSSSSSTTVFPEVSSSSTSSSSIFSSSAR